MVEVVNCTWSEGDYRCSFCTVVIRWWTVQLIIGTA